MDAIRESTQKSPVPLAPLSSNRMEQCDLELGRPVQYLLPQLSFPSTLRADGIFHNLESYVDQESGESSTESSLYEDEDEDESVWDNTQPENEHESHEQRAEARASQGSPDHDTFTLVPLKGQRSPTSSTHASIRVPTRTSTRTPSMRTQAMNQRLTRRKSLPRQKTIDPNLVTWDSADDPSNPHNWPKHKKWTSVVLIAAYAFIAPMASTIVAPALDQIAIEFQIQQNSVESFLVMSIFLLAFAIGPFLWGPLSEVFGRVRVMQGANLIFLLFNTVCGFAKTKEQMMAFRFLSGIGGSAPQAIGGGIVSDCFRAGDRGTAVAIYSLMPFISPAVAPIMGGYLTQYSTWRWAFWGTSIFDLVVQILCVFFLKETFAPAILNHKAAALKGRTGNQQLHTKWQGPDHTTKKLVMKSLIRPFVMLTTQPALQAMALYRAYQYGLMYLVFATFPLVFEQSYNQDVGRASLNYLSLGIGFVTGLQFSKSLQDKIYKWCKTQQIDPTAPLFKRSTWQPFRGMRLLSDSKTLLPDSSLAPRITHNESRTLQRNQIQRSNTDKSFSHDPTKGLPEYRLPLLVPFSLLIPLGLFTYGWSAQTRTHWLLPNLGALIFAIGLIVCFNCAQAYVVDTYTTYSASATGAAAFLRTLAGFSFPLLAPKLYHPHILGLAWGNSLLGFIALTFGLVAPLMLWRFGGWLRRKSTYCTA